MNVGKKIYLNFGSPSLSMVWCEHCKEETLHIKFGICNHCKRGVSRIEGRILTEATNRNRTSKAQQAAVQKRRDFWAPVKARALELMKLDPGRTYTSIAAELNCSRNMIARVAEYGGMND